MRPSNINRRSLSSNIQSFLVWALIVPSRLWKSSSNRAVLTGSRARHSVSPPRPAAEYIGLVQTLNCQPYLKRNERDVSSTVLVHWLRMSRSSQSRDTIVPAPEGARAAIMSITASHQVENAVSLRERVHHFLGVGKWICIGRNIYIDVG